MTAYIKTLSEQYTQNIANQLNVRDTLKYTLKPQSEYDKRLAEVRQKQYDARRMMWSLLK